MRGLLVLLLGGVLQAAGAEAEIHAIAEDLGGPPSPYAAPLTGLLRKLRPSLPGDASVPLALTCVSTPGDPKYVGVVQAMRIGAPISTVKAILDDVAHYKDLFPDCVEVHVVAGSRTGNRYVTAWEQRVPVFFLPNSKYELAYMVSQPKPTRVVYRYRLVKSGDLTNSDGIVVLDATAPGETLFTEYDFFNAPWGLLPEAAVWRESLRGVFLSDVAIKLKAENPAWTYDRVASEAERLRRGAQDSLERCRHQRQDATKLFGP